jgi:DNA-directed RNA polymerase specialized sigma24 family protein
MLEAFARRSNIPSSDWHVCITDLLTDEALRLNASAAGPPRNLPAYLVGAARHRHLSLKRSADCRHKHYAAASDNRSGEQIVTTLCSEDALRSSAGPEDESPTSSALLRLARDLGARLSGDERLVLAWVGEGISRPVIAEWLGIAPDACAKRIWRLCHRLRVAAVQQRLTYSSSERREIDRFLRRAGHSVDVPIRAIRAELRDECGPRREQCDESAK